MPAAFIVGLSLGALGAWLGYRRCQRLWLLALGSFVGVIGQVGGVAALVLLLGGKGEQTGMAGVGLAALVLGFLGSFGSSLLVTYPIGRLVGPKVSDEVIEHYRPDDSSDATSADGATP